MEVIAVIPARGGSKGLPGKNTIDLAGKPLIAYSILAALGAGRVDRVVVSTEDAAIAETARAFGAEVPFLRPRELAGDQADLGKALDYTMNLLGGPSPGRVFAVLHPTSPFRTPGFIDAMLEKLLSGYRSVTTVREVPLDPAYTFVAGAGPDEPPRAVYGPGEALLPGKKYYRYYGAFSATATTQAVEHYYHVLTDKCMLIDIDTPSDLRLAEAVIRHGLFDFGFAG